MKLFEANGIRMLYERRPLKVAHIRIVMNAGSRDENKKFAAGAAHFIEHLFFKSTLHKTTEQIRRTMSTLGDGNAYTDYDKTVYHMDFLPGNFAAVADLMQDCLLDSAMFGPEITKERNVIKQEIQTRADTPFTSFYDRAMVKLYGDEWGPIVGTPESVGGMTQDELQRHRSAIYCKNTTMFCLVGDVDESDAKQFLHTASAFMRNTTWNISNEPCREKIVPHYSDFGLTHTSTQAIAMLATLGMTELENSHRNYAWDLLTNGLGEGLHSILFSRLREDLGLCYATGCFQLPEVSASYVMLDEKNLDRAREEIVKILVGVMRDGFSANLLETARQNVIFGVAKKCETARGHASYADHWWDMLEWVPREEQMARVAKLTNADVIETARFCFGDASKTAWATMTKE